MVVVNRADSPRMSGFFFSHQFHKLFGRHVNACVQHLKAYAIQHGGYHVLADVVQVALDRAHEHPPCGLAFLAGQMRLQDFQSAVHGPSGP